MTPSSLAPKAAALLAVCSMAAIGTGTYLAYRGTVSEALSPSVTVTVQSGRAGLVMQRGALVKMNGVEVGTVRDVRSTSGEAVLDLALDGAAAQQVPADVRATIAATTIFGAKMVTLSAPENSSPARDAIADGAVIDASSVTVEVNSVFESLTSVLVASRPDELNTTLGALSTALDGRGAALGTTITDLDAILSTLTPLLPSVRVDLAAGATTAGALGDAAPDLVSTLASLTTTGRTLTERSGMIGPALTALTGAANEANTVLGDNEDAWATAVRDAVPTTSLLTEYSPEFTCFLQGADVARRGAEAVSGGNGRTMLLNSTVLFGVPPYEYDTDLPTVAATGGPRCGALPFLSDDDIPAPYVVANTGSNPFRAGGVSPSLSPTSIIDFLPDGLSAPAGSGGTR